MPKQLLRDGRRRVFALAGAMVLTSACSPDPQPVGGEDTRPPVPPYEPCDAFCEQQRACSDIPLEDCEHECSWLHRNLEDKPAACVEAVEEAMSCQQQQCESWSSTFFESGPCIDELEAQ